MEQPPPQSSPQEPPRGIYSARVDDKGRLRLPREFEEYLRSLPEQQFFVTTLNGTTGRVYPMNVWRANEKVMEEYEEDPDQAEDVAFLADYWGGVANLDGQGRILIPPELRRKLGVENQPVNVRFFKSALEVYSAEVSEQRLARATAGLPQSLPPLRKKGLK